ncbi:DUF47 domain-containing protein [Candidatus Peregrinibacteria bacterium]|nr:DUF47 domain-containing protein [Candidatus Peregrinibacteria bacterium]
MKFFLPKQTAFFDLLAGMGECLKEMAELFVKFSIDFNDFENYSRKAKEIEHKADSKAHEIIDKLNKTFITPIDREDIYLLAHELDDIIDIIENVIHNIYLYEIREKFDEIEKFAHLFKEATDDFGEILECLEKQKYEGHLLKVKIRIHELEDQGDEIFSKAITKLFKEKSDPVLIVKLKDILENLEDSMDKIQKVADVVEGIIVKSS